MTSTLSNPTELLKPVTHAGPRPGARLCSYPRPPATVISVAGEVDACNAQYVTDYVVGFVHVERPLVLDLSGVEFLGTAGFGTILRFAAECRRAERQWALVPSDGVNLVLRVASHPPLPCAGSLDSALKRFTSSVEHGVMAAFGYLT